VYCNGNLSGHRRGVHDVNSLNMVGSESEIRAWIGVMLSSRTITAKLDGFTLMRCLCLVTARVYILHTKSISGHCKAVAAILAKSNSDVVFTTYLAVL